MKIGLKNSLDIMGNLETVVDFAVNEQCAALGECSAYNRFLAINKPVFHIEYPNPLNAQAAKGISCTGAASNSSTILKNLQLDGETYYCDGSYVNTPTLGGTSPPRPSRPLPVPRPSTSRPIPQPSPSIPGSTLRPSTTRQPSPTPNRPSSTQRPPTSTPGGGNGGCRSKHWDQCGGQDWKGCTVCEVSTFCLNQGSLLIYVCVVVTVHMQGCVSAVLLSMPLRRYLDMLHLIEDSYCPMFMF
jgi:hypothetical protein